MNDLISRQAAIGVVDAVWSVTGGKNVAKVWDQIKDLPSSQPDLSEYSDKLWRNAYERGKRDTLAEPHWIPCSERLPSKADHTDDMVLVCYRNGSVRFNTYMNGWVQGNPVAWMPLPEPYKTESEDKE